MTMFDFLLEESINNHTDKQKKTCWTAHPMQLTTKLRGNEFKYN